VSGFEGIFGHVPGYPLVFPLFWGSVVFFGLVMARHLRIFAVVRATGPSPLADVPRRIGGLVRYTLLQTKMFKDRRAGIMHFTIFWGFVLLTIGTANIVTGGAIQAVIEIPAGGVLWTAVSVMQNTVAVLVLVAVGYAFVRRLVTRPARLSLTRGALIILVLIGGVVAAELLAQAFEAARYGSISGAFVADALAIPLANLGPDVVNASFTLLWWAHIAIVAAFLCYLPFSKHLHIATAFFNVYFRKLAPRGELPAMDLEAEDATFGLRSLQDLGWKDLLDGFTCTECGRCTDACPANRTGKPLNPREMIMGLRHMAVDAEHGLDLIPNSPILRGQPGLDDATPNPKLMATAIVDDAIPYDAVWDCVTCGACVEACPVLIEHVDKIVGFRRNLVLEDSRFPSELTGAFRNMETAGNPWGQARSTRTDWTKGLDFEVPTVAELAAAGRLAEIEVLYWVGCAAAFDERNRKVARAFARCLTAAGVRFAILGQEESCTGDPARRMGNEYVYQILAGGNIETLNRYGMAERTIVTACPHCFNTIANEYGQLGGRFEIVHHSVYLQGLLASGRLRTAETTGSSEGTGAPARSVTFHDSCYMARYNDVIAAPRDVLASVAGMELREMERNGKNSFCCGAGGGRMWMEETRGTRINAERTRQALETGAEVVATNCPFCMTMMKDGLAEAASNSTGLVSAADIAELLADSLAPAIPAGRQLPVLQ
jgi:Fe-S oxidoreductase/nitrate reductase gamma subunit